MRVIICGAGHSMKEGISLGLWNKIKSEEVWSCNSIFLLMPFLPKKELWVDIDFFDTQAERLDELYHKGVDLIAKRFTNRKKYMELQNQERFTQYETTRENDKYFGKLAIEKNLIYYGMTGLCGTFALSVAIAMGYDEIHLLGFDFGNPNPNDPTHVYTREQLENLRIHCMGAFKPETYGPNGPIRREIIDYDPFTKEEGIKIYNVSLISNIYQFPRISYNSFFGMLK